MEREKKTWDRESLNPPCVTLAAFVWNCPKILRPFPKGQLISKCLFGFIVWTKIPTKNLTNSALEFAMWCNKKKGTFLLFYNLHMIICIAYLMYLCAFILWFDQFSHSRVEFVKFFRWYFGPNDDSKRTFWN